MTASTRLEKIVATTIYRILRRILRRGTCLGIWPTTQTCPASVALTRPSRSTTAGRRNCPSSRRRHRRRERPRPTPAEPSRDAGPRSPTGPTVLRRGGDDPAAMQIAAMQICEMIRNIRARHRQVPSRHTRIPRRFKQCEKDPRPGRIRHRATNRFITSTCEATVSIR